MSKSILVVCIILLVVLSPTIDAKMMSYPNGDRHCVMAQGQVISACLQQANGLQPMSCCDAISEVNKHAETPGAREWLCKCFQEIIKLSRFTKLIGMPEQCGIPKAVPFDPKTDCGRLNAEDDLMTNECHNAQVPTICMQCLESDPTSVHADAVGIAGIVIHCLEARLHIITNNITNLSSREDRSEVKTILEACKKNFLTEAPTNLSEAKTGLKTRDYDKAAQSIKFALDSPWSCRSNLISVKFESPEGPELFSQIKIYAQLSDAAMRIIDRF